MRITFRTTRAVNLLLSTACITGLLSNRVSAQTETTEELSVPARDVSGEENPPMTDGADPPATDTREPGSEAPTRPEPEPSLHPQDPVPVDETTATLPADEVTSMDQKEQEHTHATPHAADEDPGSTDELTEEELAAIAAAIGADALENEPAKAAADVTVPSARPLSVGTQLGQATARMLQNMNPDMSFILDVAGAWFSPPFTVTGQPGSMADGNYQGGAHDPSATGFNLQQLELFVGASVDPFFRLQANLVFSKFGVEIEEVFATSTSLPWGLQVRVGQFLTRFGRMNPTHVHAWKFVDQPLMNGKFFGAEGNRGLGGELSWLAPLPWYLEIFGSVTEANDACCARSYFGGEVLPVITPLDLLATGGIKQFFPFGSDWSLFWGLTGQSGPNPTGKNNRTEMVGTDFYLRYRPINSPGRTAISWTTESIVRRRQIPGTVLTDVGMYSQLVAQFQLQYELGARIEAVTGNIGDPLDADWTGVRTRYTAQATYYPSHFSRVRAQVSYGAQGDVTQAVWLQSVNRPVIAVFLALEFLVGAHGAHAF